MDGVLIFLAFSGTLLAGVRATTWSDNTRTYSVYDISNSSTNNMDTSLCCLDQQQSSCTGCELNSSTRGVDDNGSWELPRSGQPGQEPPSLGPPLYMYIYVTFINVIVLLVGITGNVLVIQVVARTKTMRKRINYFLISLSAADLLVLVVCLPTALLEFYGKDRWYIGEPMCKIFWFLENMSHHCSVLTLLVIGFERYHAICHPLKKTTGQRYLSVTLVVPVVWTVSIVVSLPFAIISNIEETRYYDDSLVDVCRTDITSKLARAYIIFIFVAFLVLPLLLLTAMYSAIILTLAVSNRSGLTSSDNSTGNPASKRSSTVSVNTVGSMSGTSASGRHYCGQDHDMVRHARVMSSRRQVVRMMMGVMVLYFCCLVPMRCVQLWVVFGPKGDIEKLGYEGYMNLICCVRILTMVNSASNPIIYGLLSSNFRSAFRQSLCCCRGNPPGPGMGYNTTYHSNSHHQHTQGSPLSHRMALLAPTSTLNKNVKPRSTENFHNSGHNLLQLKYLKKDYHLNSSKDTCSATEEPMLV